MKIYNKNNETKREETYWELIILVKCLQDKYYDIE